MAHTIRPVRLSDCLFLYRLRHDPAVVAASFGPPPSFLRHLWWFLHRGPHDLWIMLVGSERAGWVRADAGEVSVAVLPAFRGQKLAAYYILLVSEYLMHRKRVNPYARIKPGNLASVKAFLGAGYRWVGGDRYEYAG